MTWILTSQARHFDYVQQRAATINLLDIARGLSCECRFAGQGGFYSVAQHSVHCSEIVAPALAFEALMHDAAEAYCGDITSPFKHLLPDYRKYERQIDIAIRLRFGISPDCAPEVKHADRVMLATERRDLLPEDDTAWEIIDGIEPLPWHVQRWPPERAFKEFWGRLADCLAMRKRGGEVLA